MFTTKLFNIYIKPQQSPHKNYIETRIAHEYLSQKAENKLFFHEYYNKISQDSGKLRHIFLNSHM